ncbi:MAG: 23S rRNA (adenine(2030)-N(6))-methyltransferase RlmJ [Fluviibacter sp.]
MLSYRHAFHAGNPADVLKHLVWIQVLDYYGQKDKPFMVVDTHSGAGMYLVDSTMARKTAEWSTGIGKLWELPVDELPESVARYREIIKAANASPALKHYPGSPWISGYCTRHADPLRFFELHKTDAPLLAQTMRFVQKRTQIVLADGLAGLKALIPPPARRAAVLIDPSYEDKADYGKVIAALRDAAQRFATGTYVLWYPKLARREAAELPDRLFKLGATNWLHVTLTTQPPATDGLGMTGSGLFMINPPWTLPQTLENTLPWLAETLGEPGYGAFTLDWQLP